MSDDRLSPADVSFLHIEDDPTAHMHVGAVAIFNGDTPAYQDLLKAIERRLYLTPRYRQRLAFVPGGQARPRWIDDAHFNLNFHVRVTALPGPGSERELQALAGRIFSQRLDRTRPLWEMWLVEGLDGNRFALINKTHHCLVDGESGVDLATVLLDLAPEPYDEGKPAPPWQPEPEPGGITLLGEAVGDRLRESVDITRQAGRLLRAPGDLLRGVRWRAEGIGALAWARLSSAPASPYNTDIGPHRRFVWARASLAAVKSIKNELGGTVNDVVLATVAGALRRHLERRGVDVEGLTLKAMVPVSVRSEQERGIMGNRISVMYAPLPVGTVDPVERMSTVSDVMQGLKDSGQAVGAETLINLAGFAPPTILAMGARQLASARLFNLTITNVPGPQFPLYLLGRQLSEVFPMVPLGPDHALGVAIMSYNGSLDFGLLGDYDAMHDITDLVDDLDVALAELSDAAGVPHGPIRRGRHKPTTR